jgi:hypothetical protein
MKEWHSGGKDDIPPSIVSYTIANVLEGKSVGAVLVSSCHRLDLRVSS